MCVLKHAPRLSFVAGSATKSTSVCISFEHIALQIMYISLIYPPFQQIQFQMPSKLPVRSDIHHIVLFYVITHVSEEAQDIKPRSFLIK